MSSPKPRHQFHQGSEHIVVKGARTHNLKNISVSMPRNSMIAITGLSGSGKSSLAFDTIFAEGQRRYVESLSAYARQFLAQMQKPDVDEITGLSPAISIDQKTAPRNPRSTVATMTEIYDYLRVLFARVGRPYSPISGSPITKMTPDQIRGFILDYITRIDDTHHAKKKQKIFDIEWDHAVVHIYAPVVRGRKGEYYQMLYDALSRGYASARIDNVVYSLREQIILAKNKKHDIDLLVDELAIHELHTSREDFLMRLSESVERALEESDGLIRIVIGDPVVDIKGKEIELVPDQEFLFSAKLMSAEDGFSFPEIEPRLFSFNSPYGACPECKGLGKKHLFGNEHDDDCQVCFGARLRTEALHVFIGDASQAEKYIPTVTESRTSIPESSRHDKKYKHQGLNIYEFTQLSIQDAQDVILGLHLSPYEFEIASPLLQEIESRLQFLINVGLSYLSLDRRANTLSGGEAQRIRLASQLGSQLVGALYVLDEPTIGLHQRDNERLIKTLTKLRDLGNTIIVVEHDEDTIRASDYLIDIGPGAGRHGGNVIVADHLNTLLEAKKNTSGSRTVGYLRGELEISVPEERRTKDKGCVRVEGATIHNIHNLNVEIPLGKLVVISGVSGSGKSSFLYEVLHKNLLARYDRRYRSVKAYHCSRFIGDDSLSRVILVDQSPIGRTPRSNPATYTGAWTFIRDIFSETSEAKVRGYTSGRFSFNTKGGRCEQCQGRGEIAVEMHFLPTIYVTCDVCDGKRFDKETLQVKYKGKNVYDILEMTIEEAAEFFVDIPAVYDRLKTLVETGLGYIKLGQPASTLSGGEAQRVKISSELYRPMTQRTLYLLDEPTVGLHYDDVAKLLEILNTLIARGNSVVMIEHTLDVLKVADHLIDFGPEGGSGGGKIVAQGTPEQVANVAASHTGTYLKKVLRKRK